MPAPLRAFPSSAKILRELGRGVAIARVGGLRAGLVFLREEIVGNTLLRVRERNGLAPERAKVECNVCGWAGSRFLTHCAAGYVDRNSFCPRCRSYARHRGFAEILGDGLARELGEIAGGTGRRLLFAPEPGMRMLLGRHLDRIEGADLDSGREGVELVEDVQALSLEDGAVDFAAIFHVLEHVPDDARALAELARVLSPTGRLLVCVPMTFGRRATLEYGHASPELNGHCRDYGEDFGERLEAAGLVGTSFRLSRAVSPERFQRLALVDEEIFWVGRADAGVRRRASSVVASS